MNTEHLLKVAEQDRDFAFKCKVIAYSLGLTLDLHAFSGKERITAEELFQTFAPFHDPTYTPDPEELISELYDDYVNQIDKLLEDFLKALGLLG